MFNPAERLENISVPVITDQKHATCYVTENPSPPSLLNLSSSYSNRCKQQCIRLSKIFLEPALEKR